MAYALSAAMAVTVVPTYMMKPLVAEAAINVTKSTTEESGTSTVENSKLKITTIDAATEGAKINFYVSTETGLGSEKLTEENKDKLGEAIPGDELKANETSAAVSTSALEAKTPVTTDANKDYTIYYAYEKDGKFDAETNIVKCGKVTVTRDTSTPIAASTTAKKGEFAEITGAAENCTLGIFANDAELGATPITTVPATQSAASYVYSVDTSDLEIGEYKLVEKYGTEEFDTSDLANAKTLTVESPISAGAEAEIKRGETLPSDYSTAPSMYALYSTNKATAKPTYVIKKTAGRFDIPYDTPVGLFYIKAVDDKDEAFGNGSGSSTIEIKDAAETKSIALSATSKDIYYAASDSGLTSTNQETVTLTLNGNEGANYRDLAYEITDGTDTITGAGTCGAFNVTVNDNNTLTVKMEGVPAVGRESLKITARVYVVGKTNALKKDITLKAVKDTTTPIASSDLYINAAEEVIAVNDVTQVTAKNKNLASKQNVFFGLGKKNDGEIKTVATKGTLTLKEDNKTLATYDIASGEFKPVVAGEYKIVMFVDSNNDNKYTAADTISTSTSIGAASFKITTVAGKVSENVTGQLSVTAEGVPSDVQLFATYSVDNPEVATVTGVDTENAVVSFKQPGIAKVTAEIKGYHNNEYSFTATGYVVVAPKDSDEEFEITNVDKTELYANELSKANLLSENLSLQLADAIVSGSVNPSKLEQNAYADAEAALYDDLEGYYTLEPTSNDVTVDGLLFAVYDNDVVDVEDPDEPVTAKLVVSNLQAKDLQYKIKDSVVNFVAEATVDDKVTELNQPVWLTVTNPNIVSGTRYTIYDDGEEIFTADAVGNTLTFQTDSFSVFSIVANPDGTLTNVVDGLDKPDTPDEPEDIYDKVNFSAHVQRRIGTDDEADIAATVSDDGIISLGTHGQSRRVEKITLTGLDADEVEMTAHVQKRVDHPEDVADLTQVVNEDGSISIGTEHQSRRIEAFSMNLKGDLAEQYDVYYRVHAQNYGWLGWAKNGEIAGTSGHSFRLEGIEIIFVEKGTEFDESQYVKTPEEGDRGYSEKAAYMDRVVSEK